MREVVECLCKGLKGREQYPASVRAFCMSLHYLSPRAYEYVRQKFGKHLPHAQTIRQWYRNSNLDAAPGIGTQSLSALESKAKSMQEQGVQLIINLNFDEMNIQRSMTWCRATNKFIGLLDYGTPNEDDEFTLAQDAIVYMAVGINAIFQQPIAYYLINKLKGQEKAELILQIIAEISKRGIKVANISFDGHKSNALMCQFLGTKLEIVDGDYKNYFINPFDGEKIFIIFDPSHAIKLVRNTLGNVKTIYEGTDEIKWQYIVDLVNFSGNQTFGLTHRLNKRHTQYEYRKMHVRTAVETLSDSTADSIAFLKLKGVADFAGAAAIVKFIRIFNKLWDICNTQRVRSDKANALKSAINPENAAEIFQFFSEAKKYILSLNVVNKRTGRTIPILKSDYKTGFQGFILNINSIESMYKEYVENKAWMTFLATYRLSQDHLEIFFGELNFLLNIFERKKCIQNLR